MHRVVILDDHFTPYRVELFNLLALVPDLDVSVLYGTRRLKPREWKIDENLASHKHEILPSFVLQLSNKYGEPRSIILAPTLFSRLMAINPEVVVVYAFSLPAIAGSIYCRLFGKKLISWSTGTVLTERSLSRLQRFLRKLIIGQSVAFVTACNQGIENYLSYAARPEGVRMVLQVPSQYFIEAGRQARSAHRKQSGPVVLYVGSLSRRKGVEYLVDAFARVHATLTTSRLVLIGTGPTDGELRERAASRGLQEFVEFAGFIEHESLPHHFAAADVFVFPTLEDAFGVVLSEAAACGLPLVSSPFAGAAEHMIEEGINGYIVDPRDTEALGQAILRVLSNPEIGRMGEASKARVDANPIQISAARFAEAIWIALGVRQ